MFEGPLLATSGGSAPRELRRLHPQHRKCGSGIACDRNLAINAVRVRLWLKADIQSPEIDFCFTPNNGHSETHAGLPVLVESGCGAVAVGSAYLLPPLSSGGASIAEP